MRLFPEPQLQNHSQTRRSPSQYHHNSNSPVILVPAGQILAHFVVGGGVSRPDRRRLLGRNAVLVVRRHLGRHVVTELVGGGVQRLLQGTGRVVGVVEGGLGGRTGAGVCGSRRGSEAGAKGGCVGLLCPRGLIESGICVLVLDREGGLQGHRVEGVQLLGVELFAQASPAVGKPHLDARFG